ncbi:hypothetical protein COC60_05975 [Bacillus thuringiensis]|uniref:Uncharacterized protein n=1 Tax=Bacillus thuringiensis TaxID=1428 RepID=A0A9X6SHC1_BACTU|nr:hypothetical protein B4918_29350 [Bacillus thuringiensis]PEV00380.1 hypothetical protein CN409_04180 [Bacillus sp. AFS012607]RHW10151.1 hypothetical protein B7P27_03070 [Bacillus cereus]PDY97202.1 hypothetical protein CON12_25710 [Bacillus thuringiensis]PDZ90475.1 hypothetical protein CON47_16900 [Bacillus thuringiensis]
MLCVWKQNMLKDNYKKVETRDLHISLRDLTKDER